MPLFFKNINSRRFGTRQERVAEAFLKGHGLRPVTRNFACPLGELDLVMLDRNLTLVFVEVRYRGNNKFGSAIDSVTPGKQARVRRTAASFLQLHREFAGYACRFDVIGITPGRQHESPSIRWIKNAFH